MDLSRCRKDLWGTGKSDTRPTYVFHDANGSFVPMSAIVANFASARKQTLQLTTLKVVVAPRACKGATRYTRANIPLRKQLEETLRDP